MEKTILSLRNVTKSFFGNNALTDIDFDLREREIHCLCGENGAGKSTLIKILSGALSPDKGEIEFEGKTYASLSPRAAHDLGIHVIYQENLLLNDMDVAENIFVGQEIVGKLPFIRYGELYERARDIIKILGVDIDVHEIVGKLSVANQQYVKIARALMFNPKVLIMDEPTTMFNIVDAKKLLGIVKDLRDRGISIIYISHKLDEVVEIADRVTVLRDGLKRSCRSRADGPLNVSDITSDMIGRPVDLFYQRERLPIGEVVFEVRDLKVAPELPPVSFSLRKGEVLGIAGMVGAGRTEIAQAIFGVRRNYGGEVLMHGKRLKIRSPQDAIRGGIGFITEDRQKTGLLLDMQITPNTTISALDKVKGPLLRLKEEARRAGEITQRTNLKALDMSTDVRFLSGGNQQKVIVGKWIYGNSEVIIFDEPTRGIDVNSKAEIYALMVDLLKAGKAIIMISSDMPELISISDRVLVVKSGGIAAELTGAEITEQNIITKTI